MRIHVETTIDQDNRSALKKFFKAFYGEEFSPKNEFRYNETEDGGIAYINLYFKGKPPVKIMASIAGLGKITDHMFDNQGTYSLESDVQTESKEPDEIAEAPKSEEVVCQDDVDKDVKLLETEKVTEKTAENTDQHDAEKVSEQIAKITYQQDKAANSVDASKAKEEVHIPSEILSIMENTEYFSDLSEQLADALEIPEKMQDFFVYVCNAYQQLNGKATWTALVNMAEKEEITYHTYYRDKISAILKKKTGISLMAFLDMILSAFKKTDKIKDEKAEQVYEVSGKCPESAIMDSSEKTDVQEAAESIAIADLPEESSEKTYVELGVIREFIEAAQRRGEKIDFESFLTFEKNLNEIDKSLSLENRIKKALCSMKFPERLSQDEKLNWINSLVKDLSNRLNAVVMDFPAVCDGVNLETRCRLSEIISTTLKSFGIVKESVKVSMFLDMIRWIIMTEEELGAIN